MNFNSITSNKDKYFINDFQYFYINKKEVSNELKKIKWPAIIVDTEFFNRSHNTDNITPTLYDEQQKDLVYILQYSFAKNMNEIYYRVNRKAIKSLAIKRKHNDPNYNFTKQYNSLKNSFLNMCISKKIRTIIFAGSANDKKIIELWINQNKVILKNKKSDLFILDSQTKQYTVNSFDIYKVLQKLSFSNADENNNEFYNPKNLNKGLIGDDTIQLPSLRKFFDYTKQIFSDKGLNDEDDIYDLCCNALKLFSLKDIDVDHFKNYTRKVSLAKTHCFNDVLKILYMIDFLYAFSKFSDNKNKYIKKEVENNQ
ncbi:hypothetical protein [Mycoplasma sp. HU2014]|uniref:hypothetical protein n=1 Tax=Mycoplasma sp. HU2014 TaxID=1664275 RepID=UPI00067D409A|nr:hypothetical protein [Mycoplasma sp. HU2014]KNG79648.1 hypothetical protein AB668_00910 [Mycoplasma sp. HU2014]